MNIKMSPNKIMPTKPKPPSTNKISSTTDEKSSAVVVGAGNGNLICRGSGSQKKLIKIVKFNKIDSIKIKKIPQLDKLKLSGIQEQIKAAVSKQIANNELTTKTNKIKTTKMKCETRSMPILVATHNDKAEAVNREENITNRTVLIKSPPPQPKTNQCNFKTVNDSSRTKNILINFLEQKKKKCIYYEEDFKKDENANKKDLIGDIKIKREFKKDIEPCDLVENLIIPVDPKNNQNKLNISKSGVSKQCVSENEANSKSNQIIVKKSDVKIDKMNISEKTIDPVEVKTSVIEISENPAKVDNTKPIELPKPVTHIKRKSPKPVTEAVRRLDFDTTETKLKESEPQHFRTKISGSNEFHHVLRQVEKFTTSHDKVSSQSNCIGISNKTVVQLPLKWIEPRRNLLKTNLDKKTTNDTSNNCAKKSLDRSIEQQRQCDFEKKKIVIAEKNVSHSKSSSNSINSPIKLTQVSLQGNSQQPDNKTIMRGSNFIGVTSKPISKVSIDKEVVVQNAPKSKNLYNSIENMNELIPQSKFIKDNPFENKFDTLKNFEHKKTDPDKETKIIQYLLKEDGTAHKKCTYGEFEKKNDQKIVITRIFQEHTSNQLPPFRQTFLNSNEIVEDLIQNTKQQQGDVVIGPLSALSDTNIKREPAPILESQLTQKNFALPLNAPQRNVTFKIKGHDPVTGNYQLEIYDSVINPPKLFFTEKNVGSMQNALPQQQQQTNIVQCPSNLKKSVKNQVDMIPNSVLPLKNIHPSSVIVKQDPAPLFITPAAKKFIESTSPINEISSSIKPKTIQSSAIGKSCQKDIYFLGSNLQNKKPALNRYDHCHQVQPSMDISIHDNFNILRNELISACNYIQEGRATSSAKKTSLTNTGNRKSVNKKIPINQTLKSKKHYLNQVITFPNNEEIKSPLPETIRLSQNTFDTKISSVNRSLQPATMPIIQNLSLLNNSLGENEFVQEHQKLKIEKLENTDSSFLSQVANSEPDNAVDFLLSFGDSINKTIDLSSEYSSSADSDVDDSEFNELFSGLSKINQEIKNYVPKIENKVDYSKLDEVFSGVSEINQENKDNITKINSNVVTKSSSSKPIVIENKILSEHERIDFSYLNTIPQFETPTRSRNFHSIGETISLKPCDLIIKNEKSDIIELAPLVIVPPPDECEKNNSEYFFKELSEVKTSKDSTQTSDQNFTNPMNIEEKEPNYQQTFENKISSQFVFNTAQENSIWPNRDFFENNVVENDNKSILMSPKYSSNFFVNSENDKMSSNKRHSTKSSSSIINFDQGQQKNLLNIELMDSNFSQNQPFLKESKMIERSDDPSQIQIVDNIRVLDKSASKSLTPGLQNSSDKNKFENMQLRMKQIGKEIFISFEDQSESSDLKNLKCAASSIESNTSFDNSNTDSIKNLVKSNETTTIKQKKTQLAAKTVTVSKLKKKDIKIPVKLKKPILRKLGANKNFDLENNKSTQNVLDTSKEKNLDDNVENTIDMSSETVSELKLIKIEKNQSPTKNPTYLQLNTERIDESMSFCDNMETRSENIETKQEKIFEENVLFEIHEIIESLPHEEDIEKTKKEPVNENLENSNNDYFMDIDTSIKSPTIIKSQNVQNETLPCIVSNTEEDLFNNFKEETQGYAVQNIYENRQIDENQSQNVGNCSGGISEELQNPSSYNEIIETPLNFVVNENSALDVDQLNISISNNDERNTSKHLSLAESSPKSIKNLDDDVPTKRRRISSSSEEENLLSLQKRFLQQISSQLISPSSDDIENIPLKKRRTQKINAAVITKNFDEPVVRQDEESKPFIKTEIKNKPSYVLPNNNRTKPKKGSKQLHPQLLLIENRQDIDKVDLIIFNKSKTPKTTEVRCGLCKKIVTKKLWNQHLGTHYGVGWKEGEEPVDLTLHCVVLNKINDYLKSSKSELIKCRLCGMGYKSGLGMLTHLDTCGLSKEEKYTDCEYCNRSFSKLSISSHYKICTEYKKKLLDETKDDFEIQSNVEVLSNTGRLKRKSTLKAEKKLKKIDADNKFDPNEHIKMVTGLKGGVLKKIQKEIKSKGSVKCEGCEKLFSDYDAIFLHGKICTKIIRSGYNCKLCKFHSEEIRIVQQHILDHHKDLDLNEKKDFSDSDNDVVLDLNSSSESDDDCSSGVNENEILSGDEEISDSDLISERSQKFRRPLRVIKQKDSLENSKFSKLIECEKSAFFDLLKNVVSWTKKFEDIHYSKTLLFGDLLPDPVLPSNLMFEDYYPKNSLSMKFSYSKEKFNSKIGSSKPSSKWKELERFHSEKINNEIVIFVGGPITTLNWVPIKENSSSQYLSITYKLDFNEYIKILNPKMCKSLILFYEINLNKTESKHSFNCGNIQYGVMSDSSPINDIVFLPSGGYQQKINRLGLMAVADMRNVVKIYSLPIKAPENCDNSFNLVNIIQLNTKIELKLTLCDKSENMKIFENYTNVFCTKIAWSKAQPHNLIATGYSNGFVAIWNINKEKNLNVFESNGTYICTPVNYFMVSDKAISGIEFHYDASVRWLMVTSLSRAMKIYNIENLIVPVCIMDDAVKSFPLSFEWPVVWENPCISYTSDMAYSAISTYSPFGIQYKYRRYSRHPDSVRAINFNCWTNLMAVGCDNGDFTIEINGEMNQDVTLPRYFDKKFFSYTDLVCLNNEKLFSLPNPGQKMSKEEDSKMKAALQSGLKLYDIDYHNKYGVVFGPLHYDNFDKKYRVHDKRLASFNLNCFMRINCVTWNQNESFSNLGAIGYENGFIRIINFDVNRFKTEGKII